MKEDVDAIRDFLDNFYDQTDDPVMQNTLNKLRTFYASVSDKLLLQQLQADDAQVQAASNSLSQAAQAADASVKDLQNVSKTIDQITSAANAVSQIAVLALKYLP